MDLALNWDPFLQQENDKVKHAWVLRNRTDLDEQKQDNYEKSNGRDQCQVTGHIRTTILYDKDIGYRI